MDKSEESKFKVEFSEEVIKFLGELEEKARNKILYNVDKARFYTDNELFKKLNDDIWEFRTLFNKKQYRLLSFWDKSDKKVTIVVATHGFIKKTQKTPIREIEKAEGLMEQYFEDLKNEK